MGQVSKEQVNAVNTLIKVEAERTQILLDSVKTTMSDGKRDREHVNDMLRAIDESVLKMKEINMWDNR